MQMNRIEIAGFLTARPDLRFLPSGTKVANARLGESHRYKGSDNQPVTQTDALNGVSVGDLDSDTRSELQIPDDVQGVIVTDIDQDSHAAEVGLQKGDVIVSIDHHPVASADDAVKLCNNAKGNYILLKVWRKEGEIAGTRYISVDNSKDK